MSTLSATQPPCPISQCATQPGYCESQLSSENVFAVTMIVLIPLIIVIVCPYLAAGNWECWKRNDMDLRATFAIDNARAATIFRRPSATE